MNTMQHLSHTMLWSQNQQTKDTVSQMMATWPGMPTLDQEFERFTHS